MLSQIASQMPPLAATVAPLAGEVLEALSAISHLGYRAVQLSATQVGTRPRDLDISGRKDLLVRLRKLGLGCAGIDLWIPSNHFTDPAFIDRAINAASQTIRLAAALNRCSVSLALSEQDDKNAGALVDVRRTLGELALHEGVRIADHGLDAATGKWSAESSSFLGVGIDPAMLIAAGQDVCTAVSRCGSALFCARYVDLLRSGMRGPPNEPRESRLDFEAYALALASTPLTTSPIADARQWNEPLTGLRLTLERWTGVTTR